jgi:Phosphotransferase enzyme family
MIDIFTLPLPIELEGNTHPFIGSLGPDAAGRLTVQPLISIPPYFHSSVYNSLENYINRYIDLSIHDSRDGVQEDPETAQRTKKNVERLKKLLKDLATSLPEEKPHLWKPVLVHDDLSPWNILIESSSGKVSGITNWDYHSVQPAVLAAQYPPMLSYTGQSDPAFASSWTWWLGPRDECTKYRNTYENVRCFIRWRDGLLTKV